VLPNGRQNSTRRLTFLSQAYSRGIALKIHADPAARVQAPTQFSKVDTKNKQIILLFPPI
jgi:hypothetical protein